MSYDYTPRMLSKVAYAAVHAGSFERAVRDLGELAESRVSAERIRRVTKLIGQERLAQHAKAEQAFAELPLPQRQCSPITPIPHVVSVQMDGGRAQVRDRRQPDRDKEGYWREVKVGDLRTFHSQSSAVDPSPQLPPVFLDRTRMSKMTREIKGFSQQPRELPEESREEIAEALTTEQRQAPEPLVLSVVASRQKVHEFGKLLGAAAHARGFHAAARKAFVADGADANWTVWREQFSHYTPILDFVHAISYVYAAAHAGRSPEKGWEIYVQWAQWIWEGKVDRVIAALELRVKELGEPESGESENSPRKQTNTTLGYLRNQRSRMRYDQYRCQGLPTTSSYVESTVKRIHRRVKGTEKFWFDGLEPLLTLAADYLSETNPLDTFWKTRRPAATRCYQTAS